MKKQILISLLLASGVSTAVANSSYFLLTSAEVAAGRNLRNNGTQFCEVTFSSGSSPLTEATAVIVLPKGARLLDTRVKRPFGIQSRCKKSSLTASTNTIQCKLTRMLPNQKITLVARYHQPIPTRASCSGHIKAGSRR
jgi:hypothetical protein